ncbi:hypothetical protein [Bradyrhizobium sp. SRS-191]|uniref:hypothetical protein n=1 Tax=Bradyrhizobium sp. SRS-191 TaxID=2962606 RepID=UPI00211E14EB|nr:hypothetical protein [Bradyrhizobium sp. SRS-191]
MQVTTILLIVLLGLAWPVLKLFNSLRTMQVRIGMGAGVTLSRDESPRLFWLLITLQCLAVGLMLAILYAVCFILPQQILS